MTRQFFRRLYAGVLDQSGSASVLLVASLPMFVLIAGLAIDSSGAFSEQTVLQSTANSAALAAGLDLRTRTNAQIVADAQSYAAKNLPSTHNGTVLASSDVEVGKWDFSCAAHDSTCLTQCQTMTGSITCSNPSGLTIDAVRVLVRRSTANRNPFPTAFLALEGRTAWNVSALAIAAIGPNGGDCFISTTSVSVKNNATIATNGCNSLFEGSLTGKNNNTVTATQGGVVTSSSTCPTSSGFSFPDGCVSNAPLPNDPYANTPVPPCNPLLRTSTLSSATLPGSCIVGTVSVANGTTVTLQPGFYVFNGAQVTLGNTPGSHVTINGPRDVTLFMTNNSSFGTGNSVAFNLTAPTSGPFQGLALFGVGAESIVPSGGGNGVGNPCGSPNNNVTMSITGALYLPGGTMCLKNGTFLNTPNACTQVVIGTISVTNNLSINDGSNCSSDGTFAIGHARLVL
jgi:Flp pilus assembly protein TadG